MSDKPAPCTNPEANQFSFWIGEWDLTWDNDGKKDSGTNTITAEYGGCVIQEKFDGKPGMQFTGMSVSIFDKRDNKWKQAWVDDQGGYFDLVGEFKDGEMQLIHKQPQEGTQISNRMRFFNIQADSLDWGWEKSTDNGISWDVMWEIHYQRKK
ncbi:MAG: hypothetical protein N2D54_07070 [Chloroflexota bacterium]